MTRKTRDATRSKAAVLAAARRLLADQEFSAVSIRDIAAAAGVSHGLVQHHFGTRDQLVAAIIAQEVSEFTADNLPLPTTAVDGAREQVRADLNTQMVRFRDFARLIIRAELDGAEPEKFLDPDVPTPALLLAKAIGDRQHHHGPRTPDPALVAAYINAATFAFAALAPWLMTAVGLDPNDYETRIDEINDITMLLIGMATQDD